MYKYIYQLTAQMSHVLACLNHVTGLTKRLYFFLNLILCMSGFPSCLIDTHSFDALNIFNVVEYLDQRCSQCITRTSV